MIENLLSNFSGGEVAPEVYGRQESEVYRNSAKRFENFLSMTQGAAVFRGGTTFLHPSRLQKIARIEKFAFNDDQVYTLEFTDGKLRIYEDDELTLNTSTKTITGATKANPCVLTMVGHGFSTNDEIYVTGVAGMTELNGRFFRVTSLTADTCSLQDLFGNNVNSTAFTTYTSGGTAAKVYEVTSPYPEAELDNFQFDQEGNTMTFTHDAYAPYRLTRVSATSWTFAVFSRTSDPFIASSKTITGATQANPGVITAVGHGYSSGQRVLIEAVGGMTELNGNSYLVVVLTVDTFSIQTLAGVDVNTTSYGSYTTGGTAKRETYPRSCTYFEGCLYYAGSIDNPNRWWRSRGPDSSGASRYDDFTTGTDADHAIISNLASIQKQTAYIHWVVGLNSFLAFGTEAGVIGLDGGGDAAITPTNFRTRPIDPVGVQKVTPVSDGQTVFYVQKGGRTLRSFEYDLISDRYKSFDRSFLAPHLTVSGIKKIVLQRWKLGLIWAVRNDGKLICLTVKPKEDVTGWHRHTIGGTGVSVLDAVVEPQVEGYDKLKLVVERTINSTTTRYIEYLNDPWEGVNKTDYYTGEDTEDETAYLDELYESMRECQYLDSSLQWDGSDRGAITITPGAVTGLNKTFTASASLFTASDVGKLITKRYQDRAGGGQARIISYTNATTVSCDIEVDFDSTTAIPAGDWFLSGTAITGLHHLEGQTIQVVADGRIHPDVVVSGGAVTLVRQSSLVLLGYKYTGILEPLNFILVAALQNSVPFGKNIGQLSVMLADSIGVRYGTSFYDLQEIYASEGGQLTDRPPVPVTGVIDLPVEDTWDINKSILYIQDDPYPCMINAMNASIEVGEQ